MATATKEPTLREKIGAVRADEIPSFLDVLIYADAGVGKTMLCATAADYEETRPVLVIDCEGGTTSIRDRADIDVVRIKTTKELIDLYEHLYFDLEAYYKTFALDSLSEIQDVDLREIMRARKAEKPEIDEDVPSPREWGKGRNHIRKIVRGFRDLPGHFICTCLADEAKTEGEPSKFAPNLPGKLQKEIPGFMNCVGYMTADNVGDDIHRKIQFQKTRRVVAKDRFDTLGPIMENPSIPLMMERTKIKKEEKEKNSASS
jgi:hypothetical protein